MIWVAAALAVETGSTKESAACGRCHAEQFEAWSESQHAHNTSDPIFVASHQEHGLGWCIGCHIPNQDERVAIFGVDPDPASRPGTPVSEGVSCVACHVRDGRVQAPSGGSLRGRVAHRMDPAPHMTESAFCADCHEFPFQNHSPTLPFSLSDEPLQATFSEWAATGVEETCQGCHMPDGAHSWPGAHTPGFVDLDVEVGCGEATLRNPRTPHAVPTGDPFRRLVLDVYQADERVDSVTFNRTFRPTETSWELVEDGTIPALGERTVPVEPGDRWVLWLHFGESRFEPGLPESSTRILVSEGYASPCSGP